MYCNKHYHSEALCGGKMSFSVFSILLLNHHKPQKRRLFFYINGLKKRPCGLFHSASPPEWSIAMCKSPTEAINISACLQHTRGVPAKALPLFWMQPHRHYSKPGSHNDAAVNQLHDEIFCSRLANRWMVTYSSVLMIKKNVKSTMCRIYGVQWEDPQICIQKPLLIYIHICTALALGSALRFTKSPAPPASKWCFSQLYE